ALAGADHVHVRGGDFPRPDDAPLVVRLLDDRGDHAGHPDAVGAHGDAHRLAVGAERVQGERVRVLAAELEDVPDLDTARRVEGALAVGGGVSVADLRGLDCAVGGEVTTADEVHHVVVGLVRTGDPGGASHDAGVDQVADL